MRTLWAVACSVSHWQVRTRRSRLARGPSGSSSGCTPPGSTSGSRARVSASMALDLAWRDRKRRRSAALATGTRNTVCPRPAKKTATGSHAGPVGSTTTSSRVPAGAPASAAASTASRLATVGRQRRRPSTRPAWSKIAAVWALVMPRSMPSSRRSATATGALLTVATDHAKCLAWLRLPTATAPRLASRVPSDGSHTCRVNRASLAGPGPRSSSGPSVAGQGEANRLRGSAPPPRR
jgi:hypothetical protein